MKTYICLIASLLLSACEAPEAPSKEILRKVRTVAVDTQQSAPSRTFSGLSKANTVIRATFKVSGTITQLPIEVGTKVKAGQLLAALDKAPFELKAQAATASKAQASANARNAVANYERTQNLYAANNAAKTDLEAARAQAESAKAQVRAASKELEIAQLNVSYTKLEVNQDCSVATLDAEVNENVSASSPIATLNCGKNIEVSVNIPESLISKFEVGKPATVKFGAVPDDVFSATVVELGVASEQSGATFPITLSLDAADQTAIRAGLAAEVSFIFQENIGLTLPSSTVAKDYQGAFVYIAEPSEAGKAIVRRKAVTLGELSSSGIQITSGLTSGDQVITAGVSVLTNGQVVLFTQ